MGGGHLSRPDFGMPQPDPAYPLTEFYLLLQHALDKAGRFALPALYARVQAPARHIYLDEAREYLSLSPTGREGDIRLLAEGSLQLLYSTVDTLVIGNFCDTTALASVATSSQPLEILLCVFVGIGTLALHLRDLAKSYKEAQIAIEVGKVFDTERYVINYENLGIGRLIYQLPTTLCEMFLQEVFKKNPIDALDQETLFTIYKFFENNLNVSETARKLFVHRNTLVYRLEKIKKLTGLDLREFDDAITFKVALMVKKYLASRGIEA